MKTLIVILGPTGIGKTATSINIAEHFSIPIINADSRQIFSEIPVGTAAPTLAEQKRVHHYFVGNHHINEYYSAAMYEQDALALLDQLFAQHDIALLSGGSMMYIDAVCNGIDDIPTVTDDIRQQMKQRLQHEGLPALVDELHRLDPEHWAIVDKNNPRRVVHALEICHSTGKTYTSFRTNTIKQRPFNIIKIGLCADRDVLYQRINQRVLKMIDQGLVSEARRMYPHRALNALNTVGYKELFEHFDGVTTIDEAIYKIQSNTRRYCRKQLTWYKKDPTVTWFSPTPTHDIIRYIESVR